MTKQEKEKAIIEGLKNFSRTNSDGYGGYFLWEHFMAIVGEVMGYVEPGRSGYGMDYEQVQNCWEIAHRMEAKKLIRVSKSRKMFKVI